ncbi:putative epoxide hydrolase ephF [Mycobacterium xenopi 3993]|nr:putative epoxide hydrolase ephF [Mycobacterium xenopi 3993]
MVSLPALEGVEHRFIDVADEVTIHVADAGPPTAGGDAGARLSAELVAVAQLDRPASRRRLPGVVSRSARRGMEFSTAFAVPQRRDGRRSCRCC